MASISTANPQVSFGGAVSRPSVVAAQDPVSSRASDGDELNVRQASGLLASIISETCSVLSDYAKTALIGVTTKE